MTGEQRLRDHARKVNESAKEVALRVTDDALRAAASRRWPIVVYDRDAWDRWYSSYHLFGRA